MFNRRSRVQTYSLVIGVVIGMFAAGVAVPLIFADPASNLTSANGTPFSNGNFASDGSLDNAGNASTDSTLSDGSVVAGATAGGGAVGTSGAPRAGTSTGANAPGATATGKATGPPIKVGITILDLGNATALGFPAGASVQDVRTVWQHWVDQYNANGGANGRPLEAHYATYDPLQEASMRQACLELTENKKVFLAIASGGFVGPPMLCFTEEHGTPLLAAGSSGVPQDFYPRSKGLLLTSFQGSDRTVVNYVNELEAINALKGKRIGIMFDLRSGPASIADKLEAELRKRGRTVAHKSVYSADYQTAASQVPVEVQQMQAKDVDVVVNMAHTLILTQFTQHATSQGWTPPYFNSDWNGANSDFYYSNMPASYDGNISFTITRSGEYRTNAPEPALDKQCREEASKALKRDVPRNDSNGAYARDCAFFQMMTRGLNAAGRNITPLGFSGALRGLGTMDVAAFGGMTFGPDRYDGADRVRTLTWKADCKCVIPVTGFRALKY